MQHEIIHQGPGYTIARSHKAETLVPYFPAPREDGEYNYGWIDLRDHPERVAEIPEAENSPGLQKLLRVAADPISKVMTGGCSVGLFDHGESAERPRWHVGGYVAVMFKDAEQNADPQNLIHLAEYVLHGIGPSDEHHVCYELVIEPLKLFFGRQDCYCLVITPLGFGATEAEAWAAFEYATSAIADSIGRHRPKP